MNARRSSLFAFAGEHSGDLHGGALLRRLRELRPDIRLLGVGGPEMRREGLEVVLPMEQFQVFGFTDIVKKLPQLWKQFKKVRDAILNQQPDGVLLIDYPGSNLRLARALRRAGYRGKIVYYISPTVWAWGKGRIKQLADNVDLLLTIFPFEPPLFSHTTLNTQFVGHPLLERVQNYEYDPSWQAHSGIKPAERYLALFPGSRRGEIERLFPRQLAAAVNLRRADPSLSLLISCADDSLRELMQQQIKSFGDTGDLNIGFVPRRYTYELMRDCQAALAKSGTVTLELALHEKPCVVLYEISRLNYLIVKYVLKLKLPYYCIVNILCDRAVYPEFIEQSFTSDQLADKMRALLLPGPVAERCIAGCREARSVLSPSDNRLASENAARAIEDLLWSK